LRGAAEVDRVLAGWPPVKFRCDRNDPSGRMHEACRCLTGFCLPIVMAQASRFRFGPWRSQARIGIDHLTKLTCDWLTIPFTVVLGSDPMRFLWRRLCHVSAGTNVALARGALCGSAWGLVRCRDTDDTNRGSGDTRTIRWMVKIARSETFQMSIDWLPERRLLSEWRYETVPIEPPPLRGGLWQLHLAWMPATGRRLWDRRSRP